MLQNYLKIAWRNLKRKKLYSVINIIGLAAGLFCCILIYLYVHDQLSYDKFNQKADRTYRVVTHLKFGGRDMKYATTPATMAFTIKRKFPEIESVARVWEYGNAFVHYKNRVFKEKKVAFADSTLFDVFTFHFLAGNPRTALTQPNSVVLTQKTAQKYFGVANPLGKSLKLDKNMVVKVTGVVKNLPPDSHFHFSVYVSMATLKRSRNQNWLANNFYTYIVLNKGTNAHVFEHIMGAYVLSHYVMPQTQLLLGLTKDQLKASGSKVTYHLQPLTRIHLYSHRSIEIEPNGSILYIYLFSAIAFFVLLLAVINFINLSTVRSTDRAKEIGIRKTLGSERRHVIAQFLMESVLFAVAAFIIALIAVQFSLPFFNKLSDTSIHLAISSNIGLIVILFTAAIVIGLLAGLYPSFVLSSFQPVKVLKGTMSGGTGSGKFRNNLIIIQFAVFVVLLIGTIVIYQQMHYIEHKNVGFNKSRVLIVENAYGLGNNVQVFTKAMKKYPEVRNATITSFLPVPSSREQEPLFRGAQMTNNNSVTMQFWSVDYDYISTMQLKLVKGRNFNKNRGTDSTAIIINQKAAKLFGLKHPIGKKIHLPTSLNARNSSIIFHIIGVVRNFNFESLRKQVGPLALHLGNSNGNVAIRFKAINPSQMIQIAKSEWEKLAPGAPFTYSFMNSRFNSEYRTELRMSRIVTIFTILAIFIACIGLFGLTVFIAEKRTKEIGVRKVLGASTFSLVGLLNKDFLKLVLIGFVIAVPIAWYAMHRWLQNFAYKIRLSPWIFILAGVIAVIIALATVSWQSIRAALANPVDSLRSE